MIIEILTDQEQNLHNMNSRVPLRIAIGPKDLENGTVELARRDTLTKEIVALDSVDAIIKNLMTEIQDELFKKALNLEIHILLKWIHFEEFKAVIRK